MERFEPVLNRRRKPSKLREKKTIICQFMGNECPSMIAKGRGILSFRNPTELKEDTLRHLSPYQCQVCGKRFGKRHAITRHGKKQSPCQPVEGVIWVS
ncbi:hypothetical protein BGX38DRAFT_1327840, partial [Terfezia claveryi]